MRGCLAILCIAATCGSRLAFGSELDLLRSLTPVPAKTVWHMASHGSSVFACGILSNSSSGMMTFDLSDPSKPRFLGGLPLSGAATQLAISGDYAFVAAQKTPTRFDGAIHVMDIADPEHPALKKTVGSSFSPIRATVSGNLLFVSDGGIQILDIADPLAPRAVSRLTTSRGVIDVAVHGSYAYAATAGGSILVIDIADIKAPALVQTIPNEGDSDDVEIANGLLFVTAGSVGLLIFDISDPALPRQIGKANDGTPFQSTSVLVRGDYAFVTGQFNVGGVRVFDVSDPAHTTLAGQLIDSDLRLGGYSVGLAFVGTNALFTTGLNSETRLNVMSIAPSAAVRLGGESLSKYSPAKMALASSVLYYGKYAIDVTDPRQPGVIATNSVQGFDALNETRAIALEASTLRSFRLDGTESPRLLGSASLSALPNYSPAGPFSVALLGDYGFIGAGPAGLVIFDLHPENPAAVLQVAVSDSVISVSGSGNRIAVTGSRLEGNTCCVSTVSLFDVSNPLTPELLAECDSITNAARAVLDGDLLLIESRSKTLHVFDLSDPSRMAPKGVAELRDAAKSISLNGGVAAVAEGANGYEAFRVEPDGGIERIAGNSALTVNAIANRGPIVFANSGKGLEIHDASAGSSTAVLSLSATRLTPAGMVRLRIASSAPGEIIIQRSEDLRQWNDWARIPLDAAERVIDAEGQSGRMFFRAVRD